ncbi:hypothetical protein SDC9_146836 [bioreactor metagenome]|uniref:Uncharacterized protein n=1 Tax=bioreactor metagenome TaxID=1076179 RepID=A0A645EC80_9ZZZZ
MNQPASGERLECIGDGRHFHLEFFRNVLGVRVSVVFNDLGDRFEIILQAARDDSFIHRPFS